MNNTNGHVSLIPLYEVDAVMRAWPHVSEGLKAVISHSDEVETLTFILNNILSRNLMLWLAFSDGEYVGFVTTRLEFVPEGARVLTLVHGYLRKGVPKDVVAKALNILVEKAKTKDYDADAVRFFSTRRAWSRRLKGQGWTEGAIEYRRLTNG